MKYKGRKKSKNIEDRREKWKDNAYIFLLDSYSSAKNFKARDYNKMKKDK